MENWLGRSLKHKLSLLIIISVLVPLLSLGLFSYNIAKSLTEEKAKSSGMNTLRQLGAYFENIVSDVENQSLFLLGNDDVQNYLRDPGTDLLKQTKVINLLTTLSISKSYIANVSIESNQGNRPIAFKSVLLSDWKDITETEPDYYVKHPKWWSQVHRQTTTEGMKDVVTMSRPIRSTKNYSTIGMLKINVTQQTLANQLSQAGLEGGGKVLLLDGSNSILAGPEGYDLGSHLNDYYPRIPELDGESGSFDYGTGVQATSVLYYTMPNIDWKLVGFIPVQAYKSENQYFLTLTAIAVSLAMLFVIAFVLFLIQKVTNPLSALTKFLRNSSPDEPLPTLPVTTIDEVGQLVISYNRMSSRILKLTDEVKFNESLKKEADMMALQAQINPHFLYNTLSSVHWMALMKGEETIAEMVGSLSDFLRFSLNKGQEYCRVSQEIMHIDNYVKIQSIRYPDKFDYEALIPSEVLDRSMLKLLLQPLIENSMIHGILKKQGKGRIVVQAETDAGGENMIFTVRDNGIGMSKRRLRELREGLDAKLNPLALSDLNVNDQGGSYGLRNVHNRLRLHYGAAAGLQIDSVEGEGTTVSFAIIPMQKEEKEEEEER